MAQPVTLASARILKTVVIAKAECFVIGGSVGTRVDGDTVDEDTEVDDTEVDNEVEVSCPGFTVERE